MERKLSSGLQIIGITHTEVPLVQFEIQLKGGMLLENTNKIGVSNLLAGIITKGTAKKTPEDLENEIQTLGATIYASANKEFITITGNTLAKNYDKTMALVEEMLLEPRWDIKEFDLLKQSTLNQIERQQAEPKSIASIAFGKLIYGEDHILSFDNLGTTASVSAITMDDLKTYYNNYCSTKITTVLAVGAITQGEVAKSITDINAKWSQKDIQFPVIANAVVPESAKVYFYDVPGAKQSVIQFGYPALAATDADYYRASLLNYRLGGGGFASLLTQELRESKGYTYGIYSNFSGSVFKGPFIIGSSVRSNVTFESVSLIKFILENYGKNFNENDLEITKGYMIKSSARAFETLDSKLGMLKNISNFNYADNYPKQRIDIVKALTVQDMKLLAETYIHPDKMIYLIVGDAATQMDKLEKLGFGKPILLNK
jgi:zinc protease